MGLLRARHTSSLKHREDGGEQGLMEETRSQSMTETHREDSYNQELDINSPAATHIPHCCWKEA